MCSRSAFFSSFHSFLTPSWLWALASTVVEEGSCMTSCHSGRMQTQPDLFMSPHWSTNDLVNAPTRNALLVSPPVTASEARRYSWSMINDHSRGVITLLIIANKCVSLFWMKSQGYFLLLQQFRKRLTLTFHNFALAEKEMNVWRASWPTAFALPCHRVWHPHHVYLSVLKVTGRSIRIQLWLWVFRAWGHTMCNC